MSVTPHQLEQILEPVRNRLSRLEVQEPPLVPPLHSPTHEPGGTDPLTVDAAAGVGSLRTIGTTALSAGSGALTPTTDEKDALVGTEGIPSSTNKYVTNDDPRLITPTPYVSPFYNVKDYGALGDGITPDAPAIQAALDALGATGGTLLFPEGVYPISTALTLTATAGFGYEIYGLGSATIRPDASVATALLCIGGATNQLTIRNIAIIKTPADTAMDINRIGFQLSPPSNGAQCFTGVILENLRTSGNGGYGIYLLNVFDGQVINCNSSNNEYAGLGIISGGSIVVSGGTYNGNASAAGTLFPGDYGITCTKHSIWPTPPTGVLIIGVTANSNGRKGIDVHAGRSIKIIGNTCIGNGATGVSTLAGIYALGETGNQVQDILIAYNHVDMTGAAAAIGGWGIQAGTSTDTGEDPGAFSIIGNVVKNCNWNTVSGGILINNPPSGLPPRQVIIADNQLYNPAGASHTCIHFDNNAVEVPLAIVTNNVIRCPNAVNQGINVRADRSIVTDNALHFNSTCTTGIGTIGGQGILTGNSISGTAPTTPFTNAGGGIQHSNILTTGVVQFEPVVGAIANDLKVVRGSGVVTVAAGTRAANAAFSFGYTFNAAPDILLTIQSGMLTAAEMPASATVQAPTTTGFSGRVDLFANAAASRDVVVSYLAIGI